MKLLDLSDQETRLVCVAALEVSAGVRALHAEIVPHEDGFAVRTSNLAGDVATAEVPTAIGLFASEESIKAAYDKNVEALYFNTKGA